MFMLSGSDSGASTSPVIYHVAAENARNIAVIERIDKLIAGFSVHIPQWAVGFHCNSLAEK